MNNFKAGDLALVVRDRDEYNLGKQVELIEYVYPGDAYKHPLWDRGIMNITEFPVWVVNGDVRCVLRGIEVKGFTQKAAHNIMPLKGDFAPVKEKQEELPA